MFQICKLELTKHPLPQLTESFHEEHNTHEMKLQSEAEHKYQEAILPPLVSSLLQAKEVKG